MEFAAINSSELVYTAELAATHFLGNLGVSEPDNYESGAAVYVTQQDHNASHVPVVTIDDCTVSENMNGGLVLRNLGNLSVTGCRFFDNNPLIGELLLVCITGGS